MYKLLYVILTGPALQPGSPVAPSSALHSMDRFDHSSVSGQLLLVLIPGWTPLVRDLEKAARGSFLGDQSGLGRASIDDLLRSSTKYLLQQVAKNEVNVWSGIQGPQTLR